MQVTMTFGAGLLPEMPLFTNMGVANIKVTPDKIIRLQNELLAMEIASVHNLNFYLRLVREARKKIIEGTFLEWKNSMVKQLSQRL